MNGSDRGRVCVWIEFSGAGLNTGNVWQSKASVCVSWTPGRSVAEYKNFISDWRRRSARVCGGVGSTDEFQFPEKRVQEKLSVKRSAPSCMICRSRSMIGVRRQVNPRDRILGRRCGPRADMRL